MVLTKDQIERTLSRAPFIQPPKHIYNVNSGYITSPIFFDKVASDPFEVLGMTKKQSDKIVITNHSNENTLLHEALHYNGVKKEVTVRPLAWLADMRTKLSLGLLGKRVHYEEVPVSREEKIAFLKEHHLRTADFPVEKLQLQHLVLVDG